MSGEFKRDPNWKRQHTVSVPQSIYKTLAEEAPNRGLTVAELTRSILRCWMDGKGQPSPPLARFNDKGEQRPGVLSEAAHAPLRPDGRPALASVPTANEMAIAAAQAAAEAGKTPFVHGVAKAYEPPPADVDDAVKVREADPDFDSPDALKEAQQLLKNMGREDAPF